MNTTLRAEFAAIVRRLYRKIPGVAEAIIKQSESASDADLERAIKMLKGTS